VYVRALTDSNKLRIHNVRSSRGHRLQGQLYTFWHWPWLLRRWRSRGLLFPVSVVSLCRCTRTSSKSKSTTIRNTKPPVISENMQIVPGSSPLRMSSFRLYSMLLYSVSRPVSKLLSGLWYLLLLRCTYHAALNTHRYFRSNILFRFRFNSFLHQSFSYLFRFSFLNNHYRFYFVHVF